MRKPSCARGDVDSIARLSIARTPFHLGKIRYPLADTRRAWLDRGKGAQAMDESERDATDELTVAVRVTQRELELLAIGLTYLIERPATTAVAAAEFRELLARVEAA